MVVVVEKKDRVKDMRKVSKCELEREVGVSWLDWLDMD